MNTIVPPGDAGPTRRPKILLTRGIPGSGKSTWARAWVVEYPSQRMRVNRDELRRMMHGAVAHLSREQEAAVTAAQHAIARDGLGRGLDVVVDDTNLRAKTIRDWMRVGPVVAVDFPVDLETAIRRDAARPEPVGADVIRDFFERFTRRGGQLRPLPERTNDSHDGSAYVAVPGTPPAYIFDVDGTLAHISGEHPRSPYEWARVAEDEPDAAVVHLARVLARDHSIVVVSGRDESCRPQTEAWLARQGVRWDELLMRPTGDTSGDHLVKLRLFNDRIRARYTVLGVVDDRNRVVAMWRSLGLTCFQAYEGDF